MRTIETIAYLYDELPNEVAKEKARNWYRDVVFTDSHDWEHVLDDVVCAAEIIGITISQSPVKLTGGGTRMDHNIVFSVFGNQDDVAYFEGTYRYAKGSAKKVRKYRPKDMALHRIADELQRAQAHRSYRLVASCSIRRGHSHTGYMEVCVEDPQNTHLVDTGGAKSTVRRSMRRFADWIFCQLEESIRANEYKFDAYGGRV